MKKLALILIGSVLLVQPGFAQAAAPEAPPPEKRWPTFDLTFAGGGPKDLVAAIEKATGKPLNAIVPKEFERIEIPPMKFTSVTVRDLFEALNRSSIQIVGIGNGATQQRSYGFETRSQGDNPVWYFQSSRPATTGNQNYCSFYQLAGFLKDYKIEDITTAIKTGWQMLDVSPAPQLKFHSETQLLIAVGPPEHLRIIESVLRELQKAPPTKPAAPETSASKKDGVPTK